MVRLNGSCRVGWVGAVLLLAISAAPAQSVLPTTTATQPQQLSTQSAIDVKAFRFIGNTVVSTPDLQQAVAPFLRKITPEQLEEARRAATRLYVDRGYINSGGVIPDQPVIDGVITIQIIEGKLSDILVSGNKRLRRGYLLDRVAGKNGEVLNIVELKNRLELLREDPNLQRVNAELRPGDSAGDSKLDLRIQEKIPWQLGLEFANNRPSSVGADQLSLFGATTDLTGNGDSLTARWGLLKGAFIDTHFANVDDVSLNYTLPISPSNTTISLDYVRSDVPVVEEQFAPLNISSQSESYSVTLRQPLYRRPGTELALFVTGAVRKNRTDLDGQAFSFSPGTINGRGNVTVIRVGQDFTTRTQREVFSLRNTLTIGVDALGATVGGGNVPDGQFAAWLGQAQYVRRLFDSNAQLILRTNAQVASDALLPLEQMAIGGMGTVRGYQENQLVRDDGITGTVEVRLPVIERAGRSVVEVAPFFDIGYGRNVRDFGGGIEQGQLLYSAGVGLLLHPNRHIDASIYYGYAFKHFDHPDEDAQDIGIHFDLVLLAF